MTARALFLLAVAALSCSCARGEAAPRADASDADRQLHGPELADSVPQLSPEAAAALAQLEPGALRTVSAAPVQGRTGPGDAPFEVSQRTMDAVPGHARRFGTRTLDVALRVRTPGLTQYPCTSCHAGTKLVFGVERVPDAHRNIQPVHPAETGATCRNCHTAENVELLSLQNSESATFDHAYRLCAQCHFVQAEAWAGGAHGKRLDGWQGRRVVLGCADCHDPHQPATEPRIPFRPPRLHRPGSKEP
jgi:hypothetical protein